MARRTRCPYCAEKVRPEAVRCKHCQADLASAAGGDLDARSLRIAARSPKAKVENPAVGGRAASLRANVETTPETSARWPRWAVVTAVGALVLAVVLAGLAVQRALRAADLREARDAGETVRAAVVEPTEALLSYEHASFDEDVASAQEALTPSFREEYEPVVDEISRTARKQRRSQQSTVVSVSVVSADPERVETLLFVNTSSTTEGSRKERIMQNRMSVTMVKTDDGWLIDDLSVPTT